MARQPTLAEILADDTGRIRPEVADLLMEPPPPRPRPRIQQNPIPRPHPRPRPGGAPVAPPRYPGAGWIVLFLIIVVAILALMIPRNRRLGERIVRLESSQSSKEASVFVKPLEVPPSSPMVEEEIEKEQTAQIPQTETAPVEQPQEEPCRNRQDRYIPHGGADPIVPRAETFKRRPRIDKRITERQPQKWRANPPRPSLKNKRDSIRPYVFRPSPNGVERCYPPFHSEFSKPYVGTHSMATLHRYPRAPIVVRETVPYQINFRAHRKDLHSDPYFQQRVGVPQRIYDYYSFPTPRRFHLHPYRAPRYRRDVIVYGQR